MMIILNKDEYDALLLRADSSESKVAMLVEKKKRELVDLCRIRFDEAHYRLLLENPVEVCKEVMNKLLL